MKRRHGCMPPCARLMTSLPLLLLLSSGLAEPPGEPPRDSPSSSQLTATADSALSLPPRTWAERCGTKEALVIDHPGSFLRYRMHVVDEKGNQVRDQIETPEGSVARLVLRDGRPLAPAEDSAERERLNTLSKSPAVFARHIKNEQANKKMGIDMLKMMPEAMLWSYTPGQPQPASKGNSSQNQPLIVLDFKPNPKWSSPTIPAQALTGLEGRIWVDPQTNQMVRLEGTLVRPVNVGWGVVAHLYPGGTVSLEQTRVTGDRWIAEHVVEHLVVRALMVKTIRQKLVYDTYNYQPVPAMSYQQAIKILLDTPLPTN